MTHELDAPHPFPSIGVTAVPFDPGPPQNVLRLPSAVTLGVVALLLSLVAAGSVWAWWVTGELLNAAEDRKEIRSMLVCLATVDDTKACAVLMMSRPRRPQNPPRFPGQ